MRTVSEALEELHQNLKDSAKIITVDFNKTGHEVADKLSVKINDLEEYAKDSKDHSLETIKEQYKNLTKELQDYQKIKDDKVEEYRQTLVKKLDDLSKKVEQYNNKHK
ncbi:hypothetical protein A3305_01210 [Rickettsia amblyommatis]|uniref:Uncharacterized protein n=1 Tax=Rickettsia amblyommatis (strain GAT-30V) TaxID=1105111 RepID=H8K382_RICAG|nr:hypothetical protein [Rickettsia amblyommatis]AFC70197.1 hypothetical protein MCE_07040 [Rickettsia amblyommatis str. GAT-30V]ALA62160.1 hypothetical protein AL573_06395 [Rickettsia amblyommatis]ARD87222.1 hypothetical protein A3305_01210 [Rickettsia amblyommatis]